MSTHQDGSGGVRPRNITLEAHAFVYAPIELLRKRALESGGPGSEVCAMVARLARLVAHGLMFGSVMNSVRGRGRIPDGMTAREAANRAADLLDLSDELDGLNRWRLGASR